MYKNLNLTIPHEKRKEVNSKILHMINNNIEHPQLNKEVIFNTYTGNGNLHDLNFNDYNSYYSFSEAKKQIEFGQFFTPFQLSKFLVALLQPKKTDFVVDLTAGHGSLLNWLQTDHSNIYANEFDLNVYKVLRYLFPNINHFNEDIRNFNPNVLFDFVIGNPPYNLKWKVRENEYNSQYYYLLKSYELLKPAGICAIIIPKSFLSDEFAEGYIFKSLREKYNFILEVELPKNVFKPTGADIETKILIFQKKSEHINNKTNNNNFTVVNVDNLDDRQANELYNRFIKKLLDDKEKAKHKIILETIQSESKENNDFNYKVQKMLYHIKHGKNTKKHYNRAEQYLLKFRTQKQEDGESYEDWIKRRITPNKVLSYLKRILKNQHQQPKNEIKFVKSRYGLKLKPYNRKLQISLARYNGVKEMSFSDMVLNETYPFGDRTYYKLYKQKLNEYKKQSQSFKTLKSCSKIEKWLNDFTLYNSDKQKTLRLKELQKHDLNLILQKNYSLLNWQQGMGKTEAGIAWIKYMNEFKSIRNTFVVSSAISIKLTWSERLANYGINYVRIESLKDIKKIKLGDIVLISFNMLTKYQKHIKKYIKLQSNKIALLVDESHRLSNPSAKRTKATLNCFRRAKYKLLATGTPTRNNINELYSQLELLYNNSINMLCECEFIKREDTKTKEMKEIPNKYYMKPFPAFNSTLFKQCFSPSKTTVFGVQQENQDIYNSEELKKLIQKTVITRKFNEIAGDKYKVITHRIEQNDNEKLVYEKIMNEFYEMIPRYFGSTGNSRKDAMLRIIRQLQLMIKSISIPHKLKEYDGREEPNKYKHIENLIKKNDEKIILGTVFIDACNYYYGKLSGELDRPIFLIQGNTNFKKRQQIIQDFEATKNGILVCTQQSLSESVNIPTCNIVICEALQWNCPTLEQFYFRTIRLDSEHKTNVYMITYNNTIEQNILALLMSKEKVNEYIRTLENKEQSEIFDQYGIDLTIFNSIITKEYDEEGHVTLRWGQQVVK